MQVQTQNIQRPTLFSDFFGLELMWNNEYLSYIQTIVNAVTSNLRKNAKTTTHNIKKSLKTKKFHNLLGSIYFTYQYKTCDYFTSLHTPRTIKYLNRSSEPIFKILKILRPGLGFKLHVHKFNLGVIV